MFSEKALTVYKTTNLINGKCYVGQDSKNKPDYLGSGLLLSRAIQKYGKENFRKEVICTADCKEILNLKEEYWISYLNSKAPNGYNLTDGGEGFASGDLHPMHRLEIAKKVSDKLKGRDAYWMKGDLNVAKKPEIRKKISRKLKDRDAYWMKGDLNVSKRSDVREKIRIKDTGRDYSDRMGENNPNYRHGRYCK